MRAQIRNDEQFIMNVESLIEPGEVSQLYFFQGFKRLVPRPVFNRLLARTARKTPHMGFVIEPYSLFLFFKLIDLEKARSYLPERYELQKARLFADDEPDYYLGMGVFNTRASAFWGVRHESYLIARDKQTGLISWIFIDILSNTLIAIPSKGVGDPNCQKAVFTTNARGEILLDIAEQGSGRGLKLRATLAGARPRVPDEELWVMGNTSIAHSRQLAGKREDPFAVIFDPLEVGSALDIPPEQVSISHNSLFPGLAAAELSKAACFPYAQHYMADSPGCRTAVRDPEHMVEVYNRIALLPVVRPFSTRNIRHLFFLGMALFPLLCLILLALEIAK